MADEIPAEEQSNYETFRDCLGESILRALAAPGEKTRKKKGRKSARKGAGGNKNGALGEKEEGEGKEETATAGAEEAANAAEDLGEFIDYISRDIFPSLPHALRTLTHAIFKASPALQDTYAPPLTLSTTEPLLVALPPSAIDSLTSYGLIPNSSSSHPPDLLDLHTFLTPILTSYITAITAPPPIWRTTLADADGCELCHRDWIPLSYHHLIPKSTHERVLKRGWHSEERLNSVAWLCRACHSFVHRVAGNEELARAFWSVELLEQRSDVQEWVRWVGRVRWKSR